MNKNIFTDSGAPKYIKCWDNGGKTLDRYTVQFTRAHCFGLQGRAVFIAMSENPFYGVGINSDMPINDFSKSHGKKISFEDIPKECQQVVMNDYYEYWQI